MRKIKKFINGITISRIIMSVIILILEPFTVPFYVIYLYCGLSDILDGLLARITKTSDRVGAFLDSLADIIFAISIFIVIIENINFSAWTWICIFCIALLRFVGYGIGFYKYKVFSALHTYANKITGILIFIFPLFCKIFGVTVSSIILCAVAFLSSIEEVIITIKSKVLNRDYKSLFIKKQ